MGSENLRPSSIHERVWRLDNEIADVASYYVKFHEREARIHARRGNWVLAAFHWVLMHSAKLLPRSTLDMGFEVGALGIGRVLKPILRVEKPLLARLGRARGGAELRIWREQGIRRAIEEGLLRPVPRTKPRTLASGDFVTMIPDTMKRDRVVAWSSAAGERAVSAATKRLGSHTPAHVAHLAHLAQSYGHAPRGDPLRPSSKVGTPSAIGLARSSRRRLSQPTHGGTPMHSRLLSPTNAGSVHVVRPKENLSRIANRYGTTAKNLLALNPGLRDRAITTRGGARLSGANLLFPGDKLKLPMASRPDPVRKAMNSIRAHLESRRGPV